MMIIFIFQVKSIVFYPDPPLAMVHFQITNLTKPTKKYPGHIILLLL